MEEIGTVRFASHSTPVSGAEVLGANSTTVFGASGSVECWYAVRTRSRHEQKVAKCLQHKQLHAYLPLLDVWSRRVDRRKIISQPVFPGYLFVRCCLDERHWLEILKTPGVSNILGFAGGPSSVPEEQIFRCGH